jgi:ATP-dependent exoDNAse (exonuclease V) beta subunit
MYVAITRAEEQLYITAEEGRQSTFFEELPLNHTYYSERPEDEEGGSEIDEFFDADISGYSTRKTASATSTVDFEEGNGREKGQEIHEFARRKIEGEASAESEYEQNLSDLIESLEGEKQSEIGLKLPMAGRVFRGRADMVVRKEDCVEVYDFKVADTEEDKCREQLSIYAHALKEAERKKVKAFIYSVADDRLEEVEVMARSELLGKFQ